MGVRGALPAGARLHSYEIVSVLGQGGFGITYLAHDPTRDCDVAIKEYLPVSLALREAGAGVVARSAELAEPFAWGRERFLEEARALAGIGPVPAIVRVDDILEANGTVYTVMAMAEGETLRRRLLRNRYLSLLAIERLLFPLLDGLEEVHAAGLLHRDIKPANIILDSRGNPTLIDFGNARAELADHTAAMPAVTPDYAAAERFTSAKQGPWTDIYGLAATLYHAITGMPPPGVFDRLLDDAYEPLTKLMPAGFAPGLLIGIDAGLGLRPAERPQSIADWKSILPPSGPLDEPAASAALRRPPVATAAAAPPATETGRGMGLWLGLAAAIVVTVVVADGIWRLVVPPTDTTETAEAPPRAAAAEPPQQHAAMQNDPAEQKAAEERRAADAEARRRAEEARLDQEKAEEARRAADAAAAWATESKPVENKPTETKPAETTPKAEAEAKQQPAKAEAALNLSEGDRRRVQAALTALGHGVPTTGYFGSITRAMITAWQKTQGLPETGFLDQSQLAALQQQAAAAGNKEQARLDARQAETALNLSEQDRRRVQVALAALGHDVPATGHFGSITRAMIAAWQKTQGLAETGFLDQSQLATLQQQAAAALAKYDQAQRR